MKKNKYYANAVWRDITLEQTGIDKFTVTYGKQVTKGLTYAQAACDLGECIMHSLVCENRLDNRLPGEL